MAETNTTPTPSAEKAVTYESLQAASAHIATKEEVDEKIAAAISTCANITFASTEEVLALFQKKAPETPVTPEGEA